MQFCWMLSMMVMEKIHETNVPTDVVDGVTDCEQTLENEPKSSLPVDTVSDTTSDPSYKMVQEDKLGDRVNEEPHTVPKDHDKEVSRNTVTTAPAKNIPTQMKLS